MLVFTVILFDAQHQKESEVSIVCSTQSHVDSLSWKENVSLSSDQSNIVKKSINAEVILLISLSCNECYAYRTAANICLIPTADKIADTKGGPSSKAALTAISEATGMPWVAEQVSACFGSSLELPGTERLTRFHTKLLLLHFCRFL